MAKRTFLIIAALGALALPAAAGARPADEVLIINGEDAPVPTKLIGTPGVRIANIGKDPVQATLVGAPPVQVEGTADVRIVDTAAALPVRPAVPVPQTFELRGRLPENYRLASAEWTAPAGKLLVVTSVSVHANGHGEHGTLRLIDDVAVREFALTKTGQDGVGGFFWSLTTPLTTAATRLTAEFALDRFADREMGFRVFVTGHLVDA